MHTNRFNFQKVKVRFIKFEVWLIEIKYGNLCSPPSFQSQLDMFGQYIGPRRLRTKTLNYDVQY